MWWTLAAASVASTTALVIAFVAYPWQKRKDRELQLKAEARHAYREFFDSISDLAVAVGSKPDDEIVPLIARTRQRFSVLVLYAPANIAYAGKNIIQTLRRIINAYHRAQERGEDAPLDSKEIDELFRVLWRQDRDALVLARMDLMGCGRSEAEAVVHAVYQSSADDG